MPPTLNQYIQSQGVRYFTGAEVTKLRGYKQGDPPYSGPDAKLWPSIVPTLKLADAIRAAFGQPLAVVSGFRPDWYNKRCGGAPTSQHMAFRALDLRPLRQAPAGDDEWERFTAIVTDHVKAARARGVIVGLGIYETGKHANHPFVHVDVGHPGGKQRNWRE